MQRLQNHEVKGVYKYVEGLTKLLDNFFLSSKPFVCRKWHAVLLEVAAWTVVARNCCSLRSALCKRRCAFGKIGAKKKNGLEHIWRLLRGPAFGDATAQAARWSVLFNSRLVSPSHAKCLFQVLSRHSRLTGNQAWVSGISLSCREADSTTGKRMNASLSLGNSCSGVVGGLRQAYWEME